MTSVPRSRASGHPGAARPTARTVGTMVGLGTVATGAGAVALAVGSIDLGPTATARLLAGSALSAGLALGLIVVLPLAVTAVGGWRGSSRTGDMAAPAGAALIGGAAVHIDVTRSFSWIPPACVPYGTALIVLGLLFPDVPPNRHEPPSWRRGPTDPPEVDLGHSVVAT